MQKWYIPIIIVVALLSGCVDLFEETDELDYIYEVWGIVTGPYEIIIPVALDEFLNVMFTIDEYTIVEGETELEYVDTDFGVGLKLSGSGDFHIQSNITEDSFRYFSLIEGNNSDLIFTGDPYLRDPDYYGDHNFWIYYNSSQGNQGNVVISCDEKVGHSDGYEGFIRNEELSNGWQKVEGTYIKIMS